MTRASINFGRTLGCGIDFGTSNSTVAIVERSAPALVPLEDESVTIPSAIFFSYANNSVAFGRDAIKRYTEGESGRFMRALKRILGLALFHEETPIGRRRIALSAVLTLFLQQLKERAEIHVSEQMYNVVLGRPVQFIEDDPVADRKAQNDLEKIAKSIGFKDVQFQYEPIAAALDYERQAIVAETVFVVDIGGGTADFSIVRVSPEKPQRSDRFRDILANRGIRVGGTDFDRMLSLAYVMPQLGFGSLTKSQKAELPKWIYHDLSTWSQIPFLYSQKVQATVKSIRRDADRQDLVDRLARVIEHQEGHRLIDSVERTKIALSGTESSAIDLTRVISNLAIALDRSQLDQAISAGVDRIRGTISQTLKDAGIAARDINAVFLTGGSSMVPAVREMIRAQFKEARIIDGDMFGSVGKGLGIEAERRFR